MDREAYVAVDAFEDMASPDEWDAAGYDEQCAFVAEYGEDVADLLTVDAGDRVLDLGCGTGRLSRQLADRGFAVVGVDSSAEMIDRARERHGDDGLQFVHGDARDLPGAFDTQGIDAVDGFDAVFSNAALHWVPDADHDAVLDGVSRVLRPGGEFVAELGGRGNVARIVDGVRVELDARGYDCEPPWYFPSVGAYAPRLESHGLEVTHAFLFDRPTELDGAEDGLADWLGMFGDGLLSSVPREEREAVVDAVAERLRGDLFRDGQWTADYRRLRLRAVETSA
ncbi:class I SAM-dependent methyltransferase [Salinigranum sp. GCM10025319]|uniref:class I SAM-dependent methyltransferase n=1 Tax=Salinigranum sp. GCM10025319 TaxID=3252687 RepID=UPI003608321B